jgi:heat-inducible transcriptional repressor
LPIVSERTGSETLEERKAAILKAVVEEYIQTAQPVGSGHIASAPGVGVSPATVRNELVQLENQGYLHQPHTSAGRVPTDKGYRFFVDSLELPTLGALHSEQIQSFFDASHGELERLLQETTQLLSNLTDCAAVVVGPGTQAATVRSIQLVRVAHRSAIVVAVLSNGSVEKGTIDLPDEFTDDQVNDASVALTAWRLGRTLDDPAAPAPGVHPAAQALATAALAALADPDAHEADNVFVGGQSRVVSAFDAVEKVREVLTVLERQLVVVSLIRDVLARGQTVSIGAETGVDTLNDCSLVVAPYMVDGKEVGTIGVLGPTRLNYPQALSAVAVVSKRLGDRLSEG